MKNTLIWLVTLLSWIALVQPVVAATTAQFHMDETLWTGATGEVSDTSGSGYNATAVNGATTANTSSALAGNPGTCGYGTFDGNNDYVALPNNFPNFTTDFTLTAWIRTTNNSKSGQRIFIDDQNNTGGYGLSLGDGGTGNLRFYARGSSQIILDTSNVITNNTWFFVAAVADISNAKRYIYVYNAAGGLVTSVSVKATGWGIDTGAASIGGENNSSTENSSSFHFAGNIDEVQVFNSALTPSTLATIALQTHPCTTTAAPGGFNAFETSTSAGATTGVIKTKIAGSAFNLDLIALNLAKTAVATTFVGAVKVELLDSSTGGTVDTNGCNASWPTIQTLASNPSFLVTDMGRKTVNFNENNAWPNVRVRISYPATSTPTAIGCSTDNFAIRPNSFINTSASDNDWATAGTTRTLYNTAATGGNVHKAGQPFSMSATAVNALNTTTTNYTGIPSATLSACLQPTSGCTLGTYSAGTWTNLAGVLTTNTASYNDAGAFTMQLSDASFASVDAADSTVTERTITSASFNVGRFVPDHFDLTASNIPQFRTFDTTDSSCNSAATAPKRRFTYIGQAFGYVTAPQATLTARNSIGSTTTNYQGTLWHNPTPTASYSSANTLDTALTSTPVVTSNNNGTGVVAITNTDKLAYTRNTTTPQNPFNAAISLSMNATDSSESVVTGNGTINTSAPLIFNGTGSGIPFDASNLFRYGRLMLSNANGAETLDLPVPMATQYWNGSNFVNNTDDNCTTLAGLNITLKNYTKNLAACETAISISGPFNAGKSNLKLLKPGAGNNGSVDLLVNLGATATGQTCTPTATTSTAAAQSYLQGKWSGTTYDKNPTARATFGIYKNANEFIYMREMY
jgi:MSHA biogenesis protein MshQ